MPAPATAPATAPLPPPPIDCDNVPANFCWYEEGLKWEAYIAALAEFNKANCVVPKKKR